jgi:hypothetical protein
MFSLQPATITQRVPGFMIGILDTPSPCSVVKTLPVAKGEYTGVRFSRVFLKPPGK